MKQSPIYFQDNSVAIYNCDFLKNDLPDNSVQCIVTSPPYWGLRKYKAPDTIWGGDKNCEHEWDGATRVRNNDKTAGAKQRTNIGAVGRDEPVANSACPLCGAWKGQFGLEPTIDQYVQHSIEILRECKRILRPDGVMFWNCGDSYYAGGNSDIPELKPKDLCLIPFRVALAAQADGWWVRSDIIWNKPNPMPESVQDRPTDAYEHIFMFTKSARYYWDIEAVREPAEQWGTRDRSEMRGGTTDPMLKHHGLENDTNPAGRNLRNVWTFPTQSYKGAHFATFPQELPERCIKAATPEYGCCDKCGKPYERITEHKNMVIERTDWGEQAGNRTAISGTMVSPAETKTLGWQAACKCGLYSCNTCGIVLEYYTGRSNTNVSFNYQEQSLQTMWSWVYSRRESPERKELLLSEMQVDMDGTQEGNNEGVYNQQEGLQNDICARTPDVVSGRLCDGTSVDNGRTHGEGINFQRSCPSQEWQKDGQQNRELRIDDKQKTQQRVPTGEKASDNLPKLSPSVFSKRECPICKGGLTTNPYPIAKSIVLDCFLGSGTTLWVAKKLGRKGIGFEISTEYSALALERNRQGAIL